MSAIDRLRGTAESAWAGWTDPPGWPGLDLGDFIRHPLFVIAAHPDDEVLAVGGLLATLARTPARVHLVWATDGEASHPHSRAPVSGELAAIRRAEAELAANRLGLVEATRIRLELPDSGLAAGEAELARMLSRLIPPDAIVLTPWTGDRHPDHEACGRAVRGLGSTVLEYPVWMWHWAVPGDEQVPWADARRIDLPPAARERKASAIRCFRSQTEPIGREPADAAVLPRQVLEHFRRDYEVVFA